jgi:hypothetical protein
MKLHTVLILLVLLLVGAGSAFAQTSEFNYQGRLNDAGAAANGTYQIQFKLFDAAEGGNQIGKTIDAGQVLVTDGAYSAVLDFGAEAFGGGDRYLEVSVRKTESDAYAPMTRQKINSTPYSIRANTATTAENVGGQTSTDISNTVQTVNGATSSNVADTLVKRDKTGNVAVGGIVFPDGSVLKSAGYTGGKIVNPETTANIAGTGTINKISKWIDASGTLGDSTITETSQGLVGIGNPNPTAKLSVLDGANAEMRFSQGAAGITPSLSVISIPSSTTTGGGLTLATGTGGSSFVFSDNLPFYIVKDTKANVVNNNLGNGTLLFTVLPNGNVGAGTTNPTERFEANGNIKISGAGNKLIFPDGTFMTTAGGGSGGGNMTGTSIVSAINDPSTGGVISDARVSTNLARITGANVWSASQVFGAGISMNNTNIVNLANPINAGDAVNKAYTDANFIKFVPGAEQLSVGDANGTAPMINLRGGSTCCSGPNGHTPAFFKVFQNGSFVFTGNLGIGTSPWEGKGYRTSWHTYKGAFRSGYADNEWDDVNVGFFSWAGGSNSTASGLYALAFGDTNSAESTSSIVFGSGNQVKGAAGFSAGAGNRVCDTYGVAMGNNAKSGGPFINGRCDPDTFNIRGLAAFALGYNVTADQDHSFALGKFASNNGFQGTFIWADGSAQASADTFRNTANNEVAFRATGGFRFRTNLGGTTGCNLPAGSGVFNCTSSRFTKENFLKVEGTDVLSRLRLIPVSTWNYISEGKTVRHIGPMAEDFFEQFKLGTGNTSIGVQDLAGVSIAAVKELDAQLQEKNAEIEKLKSEINLLKANQTEMEKRLQAIEKAINEQK